MHLYILKTIYAISHRNIISFLNVSQDRESEKDPPKIAVFYL